ncbi:MAG: 50S ribosomal protein L6 [Candidatus Gracilibacteria bacterium]|nr:50S ribosomal protein L6 [Candidatus Gracilibacteria bacterium]
MSRIGKTPVILLEKVEARVDGNNIVVKGPLGELTFNFHEKIEVSVSEKEITVTKKDDNANALWGTTRSIIDNMVVGVTSGYKKSLEIIGVGYKFEVAGAKLILSIGYSHKVEIEIPSVLKVAIDDKKKSILHISGTDKQAVGEFAAKVRANKKPEPYKGKGIRYIGEHVRRKAGKTGK